MTREWDRPAGIRRQQTLGAAGSSFVKSGTWSDIHNPTLDTRGVDGGWACRGTRASSVQQGPGAGGAEGQGPNWGRRRLGLRIAALGFGSLCGGCSARGPCRGGLCSRGGVPVGMGSAWGRGPCGVSDLTPPTGTSAQPPRPLARRCVSATGWWTPWSPTSTMPWTWASARTR